MNQKPTEVIEGQPRRIQRLLDLRLTEEEFRALRRRGTVCREHRRSGVIFKLRFRTEDGRQRVRYVGSDPKMAGMIRRELQDLQRHRQEFRAGLR